MEVITDVCEEGLGRRLSWLSEPCKLEGAGVTADTEVSFEFLVSVTKYFKTDSEGSWRIILLKV